MQVKEHDFLRHASHELRTPLAVVKSNSELFDRLPMETIGKTSVARIKRAALNMQHTTETILWLSREDNKTIQPTIVNIANMIKQLIEDNLYLLQSKRVNVQLQ